MEPLGRPAWTQVGSFGQWKKKLPRLAFFYPLKLDVFKNGVLEGSGLDFGGPGARFWRVQASIWKGSEREIILPPLTLPPFRQALATINFSTLSTLSLLFPPLTLPPFQQALPTINCSTLNYSLKPV